MTPHVYPPTITKSTFLGNQLWEQCRVAFGYLQVGHGILPVQQSVAAARLPSPRRPGLQADGSLISAPPPPAPLGPLQSKGCCASQGCRSTAP